MLDLGTLNATLFCIHMIKFAIKKTLFKVRIEMTSVSNIGFTADVFDLYVL